MAGLPPESAYVHPVPGATGAVLSLFANARPLRWLRRGLCALLPFPAMASDAEDLVYLTWIVPVDRVRRFVPPGVRIIERAGLTLFTILACRHRHFGPRIMGPLRRLCGSPLQGSWRLYVESLPGQAAPARTVLSVRNAFDRPAWALGSRLASDALPSHLPLRFRHARSAEGYETVLDPGSGSAPALASTTTVATERVLPPGYDRFFASWAGAVRFLGQQDAAVAAIDGGPRLARAETALPIDLDSVVPLQAVETRGEGLLQAMGASGAPFCFAVPKAGFQVFGERRLPATAA